MTRAYTTRPAHAAALSLVFLAVVSCGDDDGTTPVEPPTSALSYLGSESCSYCHTETFNEFRKSGHPYKLNKVTDGQPPVYPFSEVPSPPAGFTWDDVTYVIGGFGWKARFIGKDGFIITAGGQNQYNLETRGWVDYHKDERKPYDCGPCHTTGYQPTGNQDGLEGIVGQWAFPGIQCEECHGPGSLHAQSPAFVPMAVDTRSEACGRCHNRGGLNDNVLSKGGFIRHHEQYNELQSSGMRVLTCVTCHDSHTGVKYNDLEGVASAIRIQCEECHRDARPSLRSAPLAAIKGDFACTNCHMPFASKSAVARGAYVGDIRTHIFKINSDSTAQQFADDGTLANPYLTLEYVCLGCHTDKDKVWAARNVKKVHGPDFRALPALTAAIR